MAVRSRDFVGIAEGIRSHELSTKSLIENLKGRISELSGRKSSLNGTISYLEAAIAAAYEDTDEDGDPDYGLIASLEAEKSSAENELSGVEQDLDSTGSELEIKQNELEAVEEEKAQTLFEIQERARKTSQNISLAGGMYGAYAGVGGTLQNSLQTSLSSLTQAAGILGGSVDGASGGSLNDSASGVGNTASGKVGISGGNKNIKAGALVAFTGGYSGEAIHLSASQFSTRQDQFATPATMPNYHSGQKSFNVKMPQSFFTEQGANEYALSSFGDFTVSQIASQNADEYRSNQSSRNMESKFIFTESPVAGVSATDISTRQHIFVDWLNPDNCTEDGHYIGEGQLWGYKPYGNDAREYSATIMTPEQKALNSYMQEHNYGMWDYAIYSKDPIWQKLHKAAYPTSGVISSLKGTSLARQHLIEYMYAHNYTQADFAIFSRDAEWQRLHQMAYLDSENVTSLVGSELARQHLRDYMYEHNYSQNDFFIYSRDPEWQRLHKSAYPHNYSYDGRYQYGNVIQPDCITCSTEIDSSVKDLAVMENLNDFLRETFFNNQYRTVVTTEDIKLYRVYGGASKKEGTFLTSQMPMDRMDVKMGLALKADWKNSREDYCEVTIPKGTILNIGKAAPQITASGHILPGGMDQIILSKDFIVEDSGNFGLPKPLGYKTGYKEFEQKVKAIEKQIDDDDKKYVDSVLYETDIRQNALGELTENFINFADSTKAYTEICWLPKENELDLAMTKVDVFSAGFNTAIISICLLAAAIKDNIKK